MTDDTILSMRVPAVGRKKVTATSTAELTSDGGVMLLSMAERRVGIAERLAVLFARSPRSHVFRRGVSTPIGVRVTV